MTVHPYRPTPPPPCEACAKRASKPATKRALTLRGWGAVRLALGAVIGPGAATALEVGLRPWAPFLALIVGGIVLTISGLYSLDVHDNQPLREEVER